MAPKKKSSRPKKPTADTVSQAPAETLSIPLKVESRGDGVVVVETGVRKIEQMAALDIAQLNSLNLPLPPPVIKPGERGLGLGSELTRPLHGSALLEELSKMRQEKSVFLIFHEQVGGRLEEQNFLNDEIFPVQVPDGPGVSLQDQVL